MSVLGVVGALASTQHGVVSRRQLDDAGVTRAAIAWARRDGALVRRAPSVYAVAGAPRTWRQDLLVAVLDAGPGACVSHRAAAVLLGIARRDADEIVEITAPRRRSERSPLAVVHRPLDLVWDRDVIIVDGIPCTGPLRTLVDLGAVERWWTVADALERALHAGQVTILGCEWMLARLSKRGRAGCGVFRRVLDQRALRAATPDPTLLEPRMAGVFQRFGLPAATYQHEIDGVGRVDFAYPDLRIAIEVDGFETHGTPAAMTADFERQHRLELRGWKVLRFTWFQVVKRPAYVASVIRRVLVATGLALRA